MVRSALLARLEPSGNTTLILRDGATAPPRDEDIVLRLTGSGRPPRSEVGSLDDISEPDITLSLPALQLHLPQRMMVGGTGVDADARQQRWDLEILQVVGLGHDIFAG